MKEELKLEILDTCIEQLQTGEDLEEILAIYPDYQEELRGLLEAVQASRWLAADVQVPEDVVERGRKRFLQGIDISRRIQANRKYPAASRLSPARQSRRFSFPGLRLAFLVIVLIVLILAGAGTSVSVSARALPGEPLYPMKLAQEDFRLWLERDPIRRLQLENVFNQERLNEVKTLMGRPAEKTPVRPVMVRLVGPLEVNATGEWLVNDVMVLLRPDTQLVGQVEPGFVVHVEGELQSNDTILAKKIFLRQLILRGHLQEVSPGKWEIGGLPFIVSGRTNLNAELREAEDVTVILVQRQDGTYEAWSVEFKDANSTGQSDDHNQRLRPSSGENGDSEQDNLDLSKTLQPEDKEDESKKESGTPDNTPEAEDEDGKSGSDDSASEQDHKGKNTPTPEPGQGDEDDDDKEDEDGD
jgi:hypothetical protein